MMHGREGSLEEDALGALVGETRAIEPLISILQYGGSAQYAAQKKLAEFGSQAVEGLLSAIEEPPSYKAISGIA